MDIEALVSRIEAEKKARGFVKGRKPLTEAEAEALEAARADASRECAKTQAMTAEGRRAFARFDRIARAADWH